MWSFIASLVSPIANLISEAIPDKDKQAEIQAKIVQLQAELSQKFLEYEHKVLEAKKQVIVSESTGHSWLQRNWRPITMLTFLFLVVMDSFGILPNRLANDAWDLLKIGLGGYVVGRSAEKIVAHLKEVRHE